MRDIAAMHADATAQQPARLGRAPILPALSWGAPCYLQLCGAFIPHPSACQTPPAVHVQMGNSSGHSGIVACFSAGPFWVPGGEWGDAKQGTFHYTPCHSFDHCLIFVAHSRCVRLGSQVKKEVLVQRNDTGRWSSISLQPRHLKSLHKHITWNILKSST